MLSWIVTIGKREVQVIDESQTLQQLFECQAEQCPERIAVRCHGETLTYSQFNQRANQLAHYLLAKGVVPGDVIALYLERSIEFLIAVFGVLKAGAAYLPLDISNPDERVNIILKDAGNPLVITSMAARKQFATDVSVMMFNDEKISQQSTLNPTVVCNSQDLAYVIYTSGSTGVPKGVLIEHGAVNNYAVWFSNLFPQISTIDFSSNSAFDMAISIYLVPLVLGLTVVICSDSIKKEPKPYLNYLVEEGIDFIKLTPSYFKILANEIQSDRFDIDQLTIMLGGEQLSKTECEMWLRKYPHHILLNEYGPTETTVAVSGFIIDKNNLHHLNENVPIGILAPNTYAYILDSNLNQVTNQAVGELYLGGKCLARGYLNQPELTQKSFIQDPFTQDTNKRLYKTGDLCRYIDGVYECLGRIDQQIKIRGFRVEPVEIEYYLTSHPQIKSAAIIASNQNRKENSLIAYYILKDESELSSREISDYLKRYLPDYMIPVTFIKLLEFPLTANEKLDRAALPLPQISSSQDYVSPRSALEEMLAHIWAEEFGIKLIGIHDDFFELGGHSLSAARIISKINHTLNKDISLKDVYENPTISALSEVIDKAELVIRKHVVVDKKDYNKGNLLPLNDFQFMLWIANTFEPKAKKLNILTRKRFQKRLDLNQLNRALTLLTHKHEVLSSRISRFLPGQYLINNSPANITETCLVALPEEQKEDLLKDHALRLMHFNDWPKHQPQIIVQLFHLNEDMSEILLCLPHIIADDQTLEILVADLSAFYHADRAQANPNDRNRAYRNYIDEEQMYLEQHIHRDADFWDDYLKDANLYPLPAEYVVNDMQIDNSAYSTYLQIPQEHYERLSAFCASRQMSISDGLSAAVVLALRKSTSLKEQLHVCINRVKSTRENKIYEKASGCFLRLEPIKLLVDEHADFNQLAQTIQSATLDTHRFQRCPDLIKLASIGTFRKEKRRFRMALAKTFFWLYSWFFPTRLYYQSLRVIERLNSSRGNNYLIIINIHNNFLTQSAKEECLLCFKREKIPAYQPDLSNINNLLDISFLRKSDSDELFIVISANLKPEFREIIGREVIRNMQMK